MVIIASKVYWFQTAENALATAVGVFDPGDDRDAQRLAGVPAAAVEHVFLQQEKDLSVAALSPAAPARPIDPTIS